MAKKKEKSKSYTKKEIAEARARGDRSIIHSLAVKLMKGEKLSISEAHEAAALVKNSRPENSISTVDLASIPEAQNYIFITLFLAYYGDLEGRYGITKFSGELKVLERVVPIEEKGEDVIRLNEYYAQWSKLFTTNRHKDQILNLVINEVNIDLKEIDKLLSSGKISKAEYDYKRKGTILLSKYLYLKIKSVFEDLKADEIVMNFNGTDIEITPWSMVHILNRHYAEAGKQYTSGKSFHTDEKLRFFEDPEQLKKIVEQLGCNDKTKSCGVEYVPLKLNGVVYAVHTKKDIKHVNGSKVQFFRLQTFYPVTDPDELQKIQRGYNEVQIDSALTGYSKK